MLSMQGEAVDRYYEVVGDPPAYDVLPQMPAASPDVELFLARLTNPSFDQNKEADAGSWE